MNNQSFKKLFIWNFAIPLVTISFFTWFLWYFPFANLVNTTIRYLVIAVVSYIMLLTVIPPNSILQNTFCLFFRARKFVFLIPTIAFLLWYAGMGIALQKGWPANIWHYKIFFNLIGAPVGEEILFRGYLFLAFTGIPICRRHIVPVREAPSLAVLLAAIVFALWHIPLHPNEPFLGSLFPHFVFGFFLGWIFERTHSLPLVMIIHFVANSFWV